MLFLILVSAILVTYIWFITVGTWNLYKGERFGIAYDSLGQSLLNGNCTIEPHTIGWEAFDINENTYMYFGPWPSILRIIFNFFSPSLYGNWSRLSCLLAAVLCLLAFMLIVRFHLLKNTVLSSNQKKILFYISLIGFGIGSPILFLMSWACIYYESILWGLCWSVIGIYFLTNLLYDANKHSWMLLGFSFSAGLALLSRVTFGIPLYLILALILISSWIQVCKSKINFRLFLLKVLILIGPALLLLAFQLWYNQCRFGSVASFANYKYHTQYKNPKWSNNDKEKVLKEGTFNIKRIPATTYCYFGIRPADFSIKAPFFKMPFINPPNNTIKLLPEWCVSLLIVSPWLIWGAIWGLAWLGKSRYGTFYKLCACCFFVQVILILSYIGVSHRYTADFLPLLIFLYSIYLSQLGKREGFINFKSLSILTLILCIISVSATILSTLDLLCNWTDTLFPPALHKARLRIWFDHIDKTIELFMNFFSWKLKQIH